MKPETPDADVTIVFDATCTLSDGTVLRANVYAPRTDEKVPVLLLRHPYSKDNPFVMGYLDVFRVVRAGYIVVIQDVRGRFASDGEFAPTTQEQADGVEAVAWAAALAGSNGIVGTWGASYGAETQWSSALGRPAALKSMVTVNSPSHSHTRGFVMRGGAHELGSRLGWGHGAVGLESTRRHNPPGAEGFANALRAHAEVQDLFDDDKIFTTRPLRDLPTAEPMLTWVAESLGRDSTDPWRSINMTAGHYDDIDQAVFVVGGWYDVFLGSTLEQYRGVLEHTKRAGLPLPHLVIGPWSHTSQADRLGELAFGTFSSAFFPGADVGLTEQHLRWYDATLKGRTELLENVPPVRIFVMGENRWRIMNEFPPRAHELQRWYLGADGELALQPGHEASGSSYSYDPADPVPTRGGATLLPPPYQPGPFDQSPLYERSDVLSFTSAALDEDVTVIGDLEVTLFASSSAVDTDFVARLCDVYPDGRSMLIADGIIRASARENDGSLGSAGPRPSPIEPGTVYEYRIDLWATANTFLAGHRIRVDVTSSSNPRWDPNPNTGKTAYTSAEMVAAEQTIFHDAAHPSRITLPIIGTPGTETGRAVPASDSTKNERQ